jgi:hypothetical protein
MMGGIAVLTTLFLVAVGWWTGLRQALHGVLLGVAVLGLLPFAIIFGGLLAALLFAVLVGLHGGGDAGPGGLIAEGGMRLLIPYYRFLARQRHPAVLGVALGLPLSGLVLWALLSLFVLPGEARTVVILADASRRIEQEYRQTRHYPLPIADGTLAELSPGGAHAGATLDGFGRPLRYQLSGTGPFAEYRLISLGFDGAPGRDDLCISGGTRLSNLRKQAVRLIQALADVTGRPTLAAQVAGIRNLSCPEN